MGRNTSIRAYGKSTDIHIHVMYMQELPLRKGMLHDQNTGPIAE